MNKEQPKDDSGRMPPEQFLGKFAPWLLAYDGAKDVANATPINVHAANRMVAELQRERTAPVKEIQAAVASYLINGTVPEGFPRTPYEMEEMRMRFHAEESAAIGKKWRRIVASTAKHADDKVAGFEAFLREQLPFMYTGKPEAAALEERIAGYMAAYTQDHGKPLFSNKGMRPMVFDGGKTLPDDQAEEFKTLKRVYHFGPQSKFSRDLRFEHYAKAAIAKQFTRLSDEQVKAKFDNGEYGASLQAGFDSAESQRNAFLASVRAMAASEPDPALRLNTYERMAYAYDDAAKGQPRRLNEKDQPIFDAALASTGHTGKLGGGREGGPRRSAPKAGGAGELE